MATGFFLNAAEKHRLQTFPSNLSRDDLAAYFTLTTSDLGEVRRQRGQSSRLGFAVLIGAIRLLGFVPRMTTVPRHVVEFVAEQLNVEPSLVGYPGREKTRLGHIKRAARHLGFRRALQRDLADAEQRVTAQAEAHARPTALLAWVIEDFAKARILRPGLSTLQYMVTSARKAAEQRSYESLRRIVEPNRVLLDDMLVVDSDLGTTRLAWLRERERTNSPRAIRRMLAKHEWLEQAGVANWELGTIHPNRLRYLARLGQTADARAVRRMPSRRRYPALVAFLRQALFNITDELIDMFDRCLTETHARARRELQERRRRADRARDDIVAAFSEIADVVLHSRAKDLRRAIFKRVPRARLAELQEVCAGAARPLDTEGLDFLQARYNYIRQFSKRLLAQLEVGATERDASVLAGLEAVKAVADTPGKLPEDSPTAFVPRRWRRFVVTEEGVDRRYYELCVLWRLRGALREGSAWVEHSRRFARIESYIVSNAEWRRIRGAMLPQLGVPSTPTRGLNAKAESLRALEQAAESSTAAGSVRLEHGRVVIPPVEAEDAPESLRELEAAVDARLPKVELCELLAEVDHWTNFSRYLEHAGEHKAPTGRGLRHVYAAILAQGCNVGFTRMADIAKMSFEQLAWASTWHLNDATIKKAFGSIVNYHHRQHLSSAWGGGTLSSSDGQRFPVRGRVTSAAALPRYFGYGRGVTFYSWTSDQYSQYGTKVISSTSRDATYVLDEIVDNETELDLLEHTTDTAGYTDLVFALFDLLGLRFAPRIRDSGATRLYRLEGTQPRWPSFVAARVVKRETIAKHWDEMLRIAASLRSGHVTASLLIGRLQAQMGSGVGRALVEYGRVCKTEHVLRYYADEDYRRRIGRQLNKGEALHALRRFLVFGNLARLGPKDTEALANQAACLNLVTNAVILWNTVYMQRVLAARRQERQLALPEDVQRLSPARYAHINPYGTYGFDSLPPAGMFRALRP